VEVGAMIVPMGWLPDGLLVHHKIQKVASSSGGC